MAKEKDIITPEFKKPGNKVVRFCMERDEYDIPVYESVMELYDKITEMIRDGVIISAYALDSKGAAAALPKMAFGNHLGVELSDDADLEELFENALGDIMAEVPADKINLIDTAYELIGTITKEPVVTFGDVEITLDEMLCAWKGTLEKVFPTKASEETAPVESSLYKADSIYVCRQKVAKPSYSSPCSPEPTANTTAQRLLREQEPAW